MEIITEAYVAQQGNRRFSAPSGYLYEIHGFQITTFSAGATQFLITRRYVEEEEVLISRDNNIIFAFDTGLDGSSLSTVLPDPIKTKHITMGVGGSANVSIIVVIYYKLKKASIPDLVWEFIKRGKNP